MRLTEAKVKAAKSNGSEVVLFDDAVPGLCLRVGKRKKSWRLRVHRRNGDERINVTHDLGCYPAVPLDVARREALAILDSATPTEVRTDGPTLKEAWETYREARKNKRAAGTIVNYELSFRHLAAFHNTPLKHISAAAIAKLHTRMTNDGHPAAANGMARFLSAVWNHAAKTADPPLPAASPTRGVEMNTIKPRETAMAWSELAAWEQERVALENPIQAECALWMLLSGLRRESACSIKWSDLDLKHRFVRIVKPKGGEVRAFALPLSHAMVQCLRRVRDHGRRLHPDSPWIFPSPTSASGHIEEIKSWAISMNGHNLRRTFATMAAETGAEEIFIKRLLNHSVGSNVTQRYIVSGKMAKVLREVMDTTGRHIARGLGMLSQHPSVTR
jgi:integrase